MVEEPRHSNANLTLAFGDLVFPVHPGVVEIVVQLFFTQISRIEGRYVD
jgi:hypothetical protein